MSASRRSTIVMGLLFALVAAVGLGTASARAASGAAPSGPDSVSLSFTTPDGNPADAPYFGITGAHPGMQGQVSAMTLANEGDLPLGYDLSVRVTSPADAPPLADVLIVEVSRDGDVAYRGALSQLRVDGAAPIPAGGAVGYQVEITWPDGGPADNQYQGTSLSFDFVARSWEAPR